MQFFSVFSVFWEKIFRFLGIFLGIFWASSWSFFGSFLGQKNSVAKSTIRVSAQFNPNDY